MTVKAGDKLPDGTLMETTEFDSTTHCAMGPKEVKVADAVKGKKIAIFGLPGAYTPTCSAKHVPSYLQNLDALKAKGVPFEHYDMPGMTLKGDVHVAPTMKIAWFKDPDGNILSIVSG